MKWTNTQRILRCFPAASRRVDDGLLAIDHCDQAELDNVFMARDDSAVDCDKVGDPSAFPFSPSHGFDLTLDNSISPHLISIDRPSS